ncbi:DMT family transporter [Sphingomonas sp. BAUL-RG-20F-R05-02]|uniref:DMT family transporter n=1 Tax=Sphingomonas sp. BAUL-RG-20F-R05-02 TaxID=2914830 RepID=UPI001F562A4B|nr:DMT family transporter [Sphingomonas sp. BAUL-RG-20F-R05-02]
MPFVFLALAGVFWGLGFPLGKIALHEMVPAHMVLLRFAVAAIVSLPFALASREARRLFRNGPVVLAGICYGVAFMVQFEGLARVTVTLAALLVGAMPALIAVTAFVLRERVSRASWLGVIGATLGAVLIAGKPDGSGSPLGIALSLVSLVIFLGWLLALRGAPKTSPGMAGAMAVPAVTVVIAAITVLPIALLLHGAPPLHVSAAAWGGIVGQGLLSTFLATVAWNVGAARVGSAAAGVFINIEPLVGSVLGIGLFGDPAGATIIVGGLLIIAGSIVTVLGERPEPEGGERMADAAHGLSTD